MRPLFRHLISLRPAHAVTIVGMSYISLLREFHAQRFNDREIADRLSDPAIHIWHTLNESQKAIGVIPFSPQLWTRYMVWYHRHKLGLAAPDHPRTELRDLAAARAEHRRIYAGRWLHLLDRIELRPREVDILDALYDHGPQTRGQLSARLGLSRANAGINYVGNLMQASLVTKSMRRTGVRLITTIQLADGITRYYGSDQLPDKSEEYVSVH